MALTMYDTMPIEKLEEYAYALQIPYDPPLTEEQRTYVVNDILWLEEHVNELNEDLLREGRQQQRIRRGKFCHEPKTFIGNKDTLLLSDEELVFMPEIDENGNVLRYYCFDRFDDLDYLLSERKNPFTQKSLTRDQLSFLREAKMSKYPNIEVDELPEEITNRLLRKKAVQYEEPRYLKLARTLASMVESIGLKYEAEQVLNFATTLTGNDYNLFLKHKPLNQKINLDNKSRNDIAAEALNHIVSYIMIKEQQGIEEGNKAKMQIGMAIDEFMYMKKHNLSYEQLIEERGVVEGEGNVKELYWKPNFIVETYYRNGNIRERYYQDNDGRKYGPYIYFYNNGQLQSQGPYDNDKRSGLWRYWYDNGQLELEEHYDNGKKSGLRREWYHSGLLRSEIQYMHDKEEGMFRTWYETGELKSEGYYNNGKKSGLYSMWYINGQLESQGYYDNDKKTGLWRSWYDNGQLKSEEHYDNGKKSGLSRVWHSNNRLATEGSYDNDKKTGLWRSWYRNGKLKSEGQYDDNKQIGLWRTWHMNSQLQSEGEYDNDRQTGLWRTWDRNGKLESEEQL
jgi:antitoxin component YwqK of YwqJK toxin-antitoxin module